MGRIDGGHDFERLVLPHLDAAYNLARWLVRDAVAADDVVQEAVVRALTYFASFRGENARGWFLQYLVLPELILIILIQSRESRSG